MEDYEVSLDPTRIQIDVVHAHLAASYGSPGFDVTSWRLRSINSLVVGAYQRTSADLHATESARPMGVQETK
jgi:hypothetical protein